MNRFLTYSEINFYKKQKRLVLEHCGAINPEQIEEYIAVGGYKALAKAVTTMTPQEVIDEDLKNPACADAAAAVSPPV